MTSEERRRLRAALRIHDALTARDALRPVPFLPLDAWRDLARSARLAAVAGERGWTTAASAARASYRRSAAELSDRLAACLRVLSAEDRVHAAQSPREIFADLAALEAEFGEVEVDLKERTVSVTTDPVVLEGVGLGRFELALRWDLEPDSGSYSVIALDPNPAAEEETTTHPHVREEALCEGEGRVPIRRALEEGRLLDFFLLARQVLTTYNPGSAYVPLSRWSGVPCADCGASVPDDESDRCDRCGDDLCGDCLMSCQDCSGTCCSDCREACGGCEDAFCPSCLTVCRSCGESRCHGCLEAGRCGDCRGDDETDEPEAHEPESHPTDGDPDERDDDEAVPFHTGEAIAAEAPAAAAAADAPLATVHAPRLGAAAVPA